MESRNMSQVVNIDANDMIEGLKAQRNAAQDSVAIFSAQITKLTRDAQESAKALAEASKVIEARDEQIATLKALVLKLDPDYAEEVKA